MASDTTPPSLADIILSDTSIDIGGGETSFDVTLQLTDDLSGLASAGKLAAEIRFVSPSGQILDATYYDGPISGTVLDGNYQTVVSLGPFSEAGTWIVEYAHLTDDAGNQTFLDPTNSPKLAATSFQVINPNSDVSPPILKSISLSDTSIDIGAGETSFDVTLQLADNLIGLAAAGYLAAEIRFVSPSGQIADATYYDGPISGTALDGTYRTTVSLSSFAEAGTWTVQYAHLTDKAGNQTFLDGPSTALLQPVSFTVSGAASDSTPPKLESLKVVSGNLKSDGSSEFQISAHLTDDKSGIAEDPYLSLEIRFRSASGLIADGTNYGVITTGTSHDGVYQATVNLGSFAEAGVWTVEYVHIVDAAGNNAFLTPDNAPELGTVVIIPGSDFDDQLSGTASEDNIYGYGGNDDLSGLAGNDVLNGGDGDDNVKAGAG